VSWLRGRTGSAVHASEISDWIKGQPSGPWWSVLREGVDDFVQELGERETDRKDVLEWLAEWGREVRRRQSGLLLLSAHRAKGLEFDDVVILDGGWDRRSKTEDRDAARRLYYVAMTRARRSLALLTIGNTHPIIGGLNDPSMLIRAQSRNPTDVSDCMKLYQTLSPSEVDLSFAGRLADKNPTLKAIEQLQVGDPVELTQKGDLWQIVDRQGVVLGRLAKKFEHPKDASFVEGRVFAISTRYRADSSEEFQDRLKRDQWSVVIPELVFQS
jgi:ATP-dependent DNA helicase RecQ